jgi:hypothetical protein
LLADLGTITVIVSLKRHAKEAIFQSSRGGHNSWQVVVYDQKKIFVSNFSNLPLPLSCIGLTPAPSFHLVGWIFLIASWKLIVEDCCGSCFISTNTWLRVTITVFFISVTMMQSSGGGSMSPAQLARLQQQLAQYGQQRPGQLQQQQPQAMMNNTMGAAMGNPQLQQVFLQQQQLQQNQGTAGMAGARRSSQQLAGMGSNATLAMMHQQQQQQPSGNSQMANSNMSSYWNSLQPQQGQGVGVTSAMDASIASSAQLAALAGMSMQGGGSNNGGGLSLQQQQNNAMLLGQRSQSQGQHQSQLQTGGMSGMSGLGGLQQQGSMGIGGNQGGAMPALGQTNDATILQQQIAHLQRQLQQQQQQQQNHMGIQGMNRHSSSTSSDNFHQQQMQQQHQRISPLFQQVSQLPGGMMGSQDGSSGMVQQQHDQFNMTMQGGGQNQSQQMMSMGGNNGTLGVGQGSVGGISLTEQEMLMQQQLLGGSGMSQNLQHNPHADLIGRRSQDQQLTGSIHSQPSGGGVMNSGAQLEMDGSVGSHRSNRILSGNEISGEKGGVDDPPNKSFLDGSFAGGWQSNADLPDRRRIIFSILEVIRQMRPDTNKISQK